MTNISIDIDPNDLRCPITGEILLEPIIASDGHVYEKQALEAWLSEKNTSQMTREKIIKHDYNINIFYKNMIQKMISQYPELKNEQYGKDNNHEHNQHIINGLINNNKFDELLKYKNFKLDLIDSIRNMVINCKNDSVLKHIIDNTLNIQGTDDVYYPMHEICKHSFPEAIQYAIDKGWNLETSCMNGYRPMHFIFRYQEPGLIKQVLDIDIDLNAAGGDGWRPIHYLCRYSTMEMVKYILDKGVDVQSELVKQNGELNNYDFESRIKNNNKINVEDKEELLDLITQKN